MADVFISYSKHIELTQNLAKDLESKGLSVWWDAELRAGERYRPRIIQELHDCKAAIVIWTPQSVSSDYVISEADRAWKTGKLIQVRTEEVEPSELPPPFDTGHAPLIDDRKAIYGALAKLGVLRDESTIGSIGEFKGMLLLGLVLVVASCIGLFWNEGRTARIVESLAEGKTLVVDIDPGRIDLTNEGKLIHVTGTMKAGTAPNDTELGVSADGLKLVRTVKMYQWEEKQKTETRKNVGGSEETVTTNSYVRGWSPTPIDSSRFKVRDEHDNPAMRYRGADFMGGDVTLGAFRPGKHVVGRLLVNQEVRVNPALAETLSARLKEPIQVNDGKFYIGRDPSRPQIGDMQVSYTLTPAGAVSVIGQQSGSDFVEYQARAGDRLLMVEPGTISATDMFKQTERRKVGVTRLIRAVGALVMSIGFLLILSPLVVVAVRRFRRDRSREKDRKARAKARAAAKRAAEKAAKAASSPE